MADDLDTQLRALLQSEPDAQATDRARSAVLGERTTRQPRPRRGWRLTLAIGVPTVAATFAALLVFRSPSADPPRPSDTPGWDAMTPGERVAANLGWGLSSGVTHVRMRSESTGDEPGEIWSLNAPAADLSAAVRVKIGNELDGDRFLDITTVTRADGTTSGQQATVDAGGKVQIRLPDTSRSSDQIPHNSIRVRIPDQVTMIAGWMADRTLKPVAGPADATIMQFTGGITTVRWMYGIQQMTVIGGGPALVIDVDRRSWVPTRVTIAELRMRLPNAPTANLPKNVAVWDVVDQLPSESQTLERLFDLRQVYPDAVVTTEPAGGASDSSSDAASNDPVEVVRMFVDAIDSGDPELAKSLCTPEFARQQDTTADSWFQQSVRLKLTNVGSVRRITAKEAGLPEGNGVVRVPVGLDVMQEHPQSISNGPLTWGYTLAQQSNGSWLIADHGVG